MDFKMENINKKTVGVIAAILLGIIVVFFVTNKSRIVSENSKSYKKGAEYFYQGDYDKAIKEYEKIKTDELKDNNKTLAWKNIKIAEMYSVKGDIDNFNKYIQLAKNTANKDGEILNYIIFSEFINGNIDKALQEGQLYLKDNYENKNLIKTMIAVYMANDKKDEAEKLIRNYKIDETSAYETAEYARLLMLIGDMDEGFAKLKTAWEIDKDEYKIYDVLAQEVVYNKDNIIESIKKLQEQNPQEASYKMWLAKIYSLNLKTCEEAQKLVKEVEQKDVGKIEIKLIKAAVLQNLDNNDEADKLINEVINDNKDDYRVMHTAGWHYLKENELDKAVEYCNKSIEKNKDYPDNYAFLMPEILKRKDQTHAAEAYFRTGMLKEPYNYNILGNAASYYWYGTYSSEKALEYFKLVSSIKPSIPEIKYNIALIYFNEEKNEETVEMLKQCINLKEDSIKYHRTLGTVYLMMGKSDEGIEEIRRAYKQNQFDILTLNNAGCYYIMYTNDFHRGYYNLKKAVDGISEDTNEYTKKVIKDNFNKVKNIIEKIEKGKANESIKIPDFRLLY
ncbi:hypothetical protein OW763_09390 [Clostridium aestuarii]|uniref:Tetratricopeptide repeat protein n=1 Tax=Clostridium aestuarii TaxID=338193 RepID=A0ABT4D3C9_9CLOT|nr:hypothetical protein [Clostridium aestuarii]MCY6484553.1 hypothetical protein [Clostridium aestuarii]